MNAWYQAFSGIGASIGFIGMIFVIGYLVDRPYHARPEEPELWSPLKLALVEHEMGVHPCTRDCAEAGCEQCRLLVVPRGPWTTEHVAYRNMENERRRREYPELFHDAPLPGPSIIPVSPR